VRCVRCPPVAKLGSGEAIYHFLSGYTAKVAGTERGIDEPVATFSTCFGAAFMTLHPTVYANLLQKKLDTHGTNCYLVNSGWAGGPYGEGERMSIKTTRTCIDAILDGSIEHAEVLDIRSTWSEPERYDQQAKKLGQMYVENFKKYEGKGAIDYSIFGPRF
jgi:phosphoenolpyruvate carboxykinase (ATP)